MAISHPEKLGTVTTPWQNEQIWEVFADAVASSISFNLSEQIKTATHGRVTANIAWDLYHLKDWYPPPRGVPPILGKVVNEVFVDITQSQATFHSTLGLRTDVRKSRDQQSKHGFNWGEGAYIDAGFFQLSEPKNGRPSQSNKDPVYSIKDVLDHEVQAIITEWVATIAKKLEVRYKAADTLWRNTETHNPYKARYSLARAAWHTAYTNLVPVLCTRTSQIGVTGVAHPTRDWVGVLCKDAAGAARRPFFTKGDVANPKTAISEPQGNGLIAKNKYYGDHRKGSDVKERRPLALETLGVKERRAQGSEVHRVISESKKTTPERKHKEATENSFK
ncbi:hypothetical protein BC832DRAFT_539130 [Gaertneriomyces semiglobifer]|nr:hypothetical protein BC832DRAFT_539130 [Gaertneriomyces semiglobifer]